MKLKKNYQKFNFELSRNLKYKTHCPIMGYMFTKFEVDPLHQKKLQRRCNSICRQDRWMDKVKPIPHWVLDLTHRGQVTHICVSKLTIIGSDNGLLPGQHQAIIWTNAGIILIQNLGTGFSEILSEIHTFSFKKMHLNMFVKWGQFCLNVLTNQYTIERQQVYISNEPFGP